MNCRSRWPAVGLLVFSAAFSQLAAQTAQQIQPDPVRLRCGTYCLYVSLRALDVPIASVAELEQRLGGPPGPQGYSLSQLQDAAKSYGAHTLAVQTSFDNLRKRQPPFACIAHISDNHFVNFAGFLPDDRVEVFNPPQRPTQFPMALLEKQWSGKALLISMQPLVGEEDLPISFPMRYLLAALAIPIILLPACLLLVKGRRKQPAP